MIIMQLERIGTDTEYFVAREGVITSAIGQIGGSKEAPLMVHGGNLQEDNVLAEFAIDPVDSAEDFVNNIRDVESQLMATLDQKGLNIVRIPVHHFKKEELVSWGEQALTLGCSPDFNAYLQTDNPRPSGRTTLRTAAGHVHFSYDAPNLDTTCDIIKCLDYTLGLWSVVRDSDKERRKLYGKAGSCRVKAYGGEYRVLSNFWLNSDDDIRLVYEVTKICVEQHRTLLPLFEGFAKSGEVRHYIDECVTENATILLKLVGDACNVEFH